MYMYYNIKMFKTAANLSERAAGSIVLVIFNGVLYHVHALTGLLAMGRKETSKSVDVIEDT
jgi:hypothetical protein